MRTYKITIENDPTESIGVVKENHGGIVGCHYVENLHRIEYMHMTAVGMIHGELFIEPDDTQSIGFKAKIKLDSGVEIPLTITNYDVRWR